MSGRAIRVGAVAAVVLASLAAGVAGMAVFRVERDLDVGKIALSVQPGHKGALDIYVPLVDWGARFDAVRLPARLSVDVRTVDRGTARRRAPRAIPAAR